MFIQHLEEEEGHHFHRVKIPEEEEEEGHHFHCFEIA
jgi:hypothetical protein